MKTHQPPATTHHPPPTSHHPPPTTHPTIPLTVHHLRFTVRVTATIGFGEFKGSALRGAFTSTLRRTFCPEWRAERTESLHRSLCPVCQLLSLENDESTAGDLRRPYALWPPLDTRTVYEPGERFTFDLLLIGDNLHFLPYLILAAQGMGETSGVGRKDKQGRRGHFTIEAIDAANPMTGAVQPLLEADGRMVQQPANPVTYTQVVAAATRMLPDLAAHDHRLTVHFRTPTRLIRSRELVRQPEFFPLAKQTVLRMLDLCAQHGGGRPDVHLKDDIYPHIEQVEQVEDQTRWWDLKGYSGRLHRKQVLGGLVGSATYRAPDWRPLLPWLLWGSVVGVGKNVVKGCGRVAVSC